MNRSQNGLEGHVALITGASRGIGRAIAAELASQGADVCLCATNSITLNDVVEELRASGGHAEAWKLDVTDRYACFDITQKIKESRGRIDILVNAAGVYKARGFLDYAPSDFSSMLDVNLFGTINLIQAVLPGMAQRSYGRIVNIASTAGKWGSLNQSAYNVSKHAVVGLTRCVALEFAQSGVTVNAVCPGMVQTDLSDQLWQQQAAVTGTGGAERRRRSIAAFRWAVIWPRTK